MGEQVYYNRDGQMVTISRVVLRGTTYSMANITSVKMVERPPKRGCATLLAILGGIIALGALAQESPWGALVIGLLVLGLGIFWFRSLKPTYVIVLNSASGELQALSSYDIDHISGIVEAITQAIVDRG